MRFKKNSLYVIGMTTYVCIEANEKHALVVPTGTGLVLNQQTGNIITEPTKLEFEPRPIDGFIMDPNHPVLSDSTDPSGDRECKHCGKPFARVKRQAFCSGACRQAAYRKRELV